MKFRLLEYLAFGPFTGTTLDFGDGKGLFVVQGDNEAGKSSALRGLIDFLYGIGQQSDDNFIHDYKALSLRGVFEPEGESYDLTRFKRRKNDLVDADNTPVPQERMTGLLGGLDRFSFSKLFGIGHAELSAGGDAIFESGGALGQAVVAASGVSSLRRIHESLEAQAGALFKPQAQKPSINAAVKELTELRKQQKQAQTLPSDWSSQKQELDGLIKKRSDLQERMDALERQRGRLERTKQAMGPAVRRSELLAGLDAVKHAPALSSDFAERRSAAQQELALARREVERINAQVKDCKDKLAALVVDDKLVASEELVARLFKAIGAHKKARSNYAQLKRDRDTQRESALRILAELSGDGETKQVEDFRLRKVDIARITELADKHGALEAEKSNAQKETARLKSIIEVEANRLKSMPVVRDSAELRGLLDRLAPGGDLEAQLSEKQAAATAQEEQAQKDLERLGLWRGDLDEMERQDIPQAETISLFEQRQEVIAEELRTAQTAELNAQKTIDKNEEAARRLQGEGDVPTLEALRHARNQRDAGWLVVKSRLEGGSASENDFLTSVGAQSLPDGYELCVREADHVADALRTDAKRAGQLKGLLDAVADGKKELEAAKSDIARAKASQQEFKEEWRTLWSPLGFEPKSPKEMLGWVKDWKDILRSIAVVRESRAHIDTLQRRIAAAKSSLQDVLRRYGIAFEQGASLVGLRNVAEVEAAGLETQAREREALCEKIAEKEKELAQAATRFELSSRQLEEWQELWGSAVERLGLGRHAMPAEVREVLDQVSEMMLAWDKAEDIGLRMTGITNDYNVFARDVQDAVARLVPDLPADDPIQAADVLYERLQEVKKNAGEQARLQNELTAAQKELETARQKEIRQSELLKVLCGEAGCESEDSLAQVERDAAERKRLEEALGQIESQLSELAAGETLDDFCRQVGQADADDVHASLMRNKDELAELTVRRDEVIEALVIKQNEFDKLDGTSRAAELAEKSQSVAAAMQQDVDRYIRLHLASRVVATEIERYRRRHQGPVLEQASRIFARLTLGNYSAVEADFDKAGTPIIVAVRGEGEHVRVAGLSDGTRDQLYLALRLAGLHRYIDNNRPLPFIVDDILVHFDDARAQATLAELACLADKTQVILFTHHKHLLDLAQAAVPGETLHILNL